MRFRTVLRYSSHVVTAAMVPGTLVTAGQSHIDFQGQFMKIDIIPVFTKALVRG